MSIQQVLKIGERSLLQRSAEVVEFNSIQLDSLINDMWDTMVEQRGAGLAAPQIAINQRVIVFGYDHNPRYPDAPAVPETVLINPTITASSEQIDYAWEGCLSVPGMRGLVPRFVHIRYQGYDQSGNKVDRQVSDFHARVVQHECDHLDGILYPQRIEDMRYFGFGEELDNNDYLEPQPCDDA
ncbi:MAG: peptide deformylase [Gammaproteobacteria bacterium]|nr:peptide deformylase [Gammaproteobacteria bacterium]